jgi:hypothetical protein
MLKLQGLSKNEEKSHLLALRGGSARSVLHKCQKVGATLVLHYAITYCLLLSGSIYTANTLPDERSSAFSWGFLLLVTSFPPVYISQA